MARHDTAHTTLISPQANDDMNTTFDRLKTILVRDYKADPEALVPASSLQSLNIDSLGTVELLWTMEEEFGIKLPGDPVDLPDVAAVVSYIDSLVATQITGAGVPAEGRPIPAVGEP
jgi:acyl carrier protein